MRSLANQLQVVLRAHPRTMRGHAGQGPGWQSSMQSCLCPHSSCLPHVSPAEAGLQLLHLRFAPAEMPCCNKDGAILLQAALDELWCMRVACLTTRMCWKPQAGLGFDLLATVAQVLGGHRCCRVLAAAFGAAPCRCMLPAKHLHAISFPNFPHFARHAR